MKNRNLSTNLFASAVAAFCGVASVHAATILDQQQLLYDAGLSARTLKGYTVWQSFTAGVSGTLTEIDMGFFNNMSGDAQLQIFLGEGTLGPLLQTLTVPVVGVSLPAITWNDWTVSVPVVASLQYTFNIIPNAATLPDPYGVGLGASNPYPGGVLGLNDPSGTYRTNFDAVFRTDVTVPEPSAILYCVGLTTFICSRQGLTMRCSKRLRPLRALRHKALFRHPTGASTK